MSASLLVPPFWWFSSGPKWRSEAIWRPKSFKSTPVRVPSLPCPLVGAKVVEHLSGFNWIEIGGVPVWVRIMSVVPTSPLGDSAIPLNATCLEEGSC